MSVCKASIPWDITDTLSSDLACTLGKGHKSPHHTEIRETNSREEGRVRLEIVTDITWTDE